MNSGETTITLTKEEVAMISRTLSEYESRHSPFNHKYVEICGKIREKLGLK